MYRMNILIYRRIAEVKYYFISSYYIFCYDVRV